MRYPPFCPSSTCSCHLKPPSNRSWCSLDGCYLTKAKGVIRRFRCRYCGRRFSVQTFSLDFAVKRPIPYRSLFIQLKSTAGIRHIARNLGVSERLILNRISRLARQSLAIHSKLKNSICLQENMVADGFESYTTSQYFPNNIHLLVGKRSQFLFAMDYANLRRKGRMTEEQKRRREILEQLWKPTPGAICRSFARLMDELYSLLEQSCQKITQLFTDEHRSYLKVLLRHQLIKKALRDRRLIHIRISSKEHRDLRNHLFSVNYFDRELRKDCANHVRETTQFSRNASCCMERMAVYMVYHNYAKPYRINGKDNRTHACQAGVNMKVFAKEWKTFFTRRRFLSRCNLSVSEAMVWLRFIATPMRLEATYCPKFAWD